MYAKKCTFNPECDLKEVEPFGFVDLKDAFVERCVPSQVGESDSDYNGIENPESIIGMPGDVFDALRAAAELEKAAAELEKAAAGDNNNQTDGN